MSPDIHELRGATQNEVPYIGHRAIPFDFELFGKTRHDYLLSDLLISPVFWYNLHVIQIMSRSPMPNPQASRTSSVLTITLISAPL